MDRPILVPLDGSPRAEHAIAHALTLAHRSGSSIHLARVHSDPPLVGASSVSAAARERWLQDVEAGAARAELYLHEVAGRIRSQLSSGRVRVTLLREGGDVVRALTMLARRLHAGSIVIASRDRSPFARWAWFSVADGLIRHSGLPVVVVTDRTHARALPAVPRVLLPVCDVPEHGAALAVAAAFARGCGANVTLLRILEGDGACVGPQSRLVPGDATALADLRAAATIMGSAHTEVLQHHDRVEGILHAAARAAADIIIMPTRRRGRLEILLGSTASGVLRHAHVPVVIIGPRAAAPATDAEVAAPDSSEDEPALFV